MADKIETRPKEEVAKPPAVESAEDSDPDFDDLDDVLDQFSANAPSQTTKSQAKTPASGPGRPDDVASSLAAQPVPDGPRPDETEKQFISRLSAEMSKMMASLQNDSGTSMQSPEDIARMGKELEEFTENMEKQGVKPEDLLKAILGEEQGSQLAEAARQDRDRIEAEEAASSKSPETSQAPTSSAAVKSSSKGNTSFEDTIRRTMSRLNESDTNATSAVKASSSKSDEDMLAELLKGLDSSAGGLGAGGDGSEEGLSKMFLDMMHQLTHKSMLYEPMKELDDQYPEWLENNKPPKQTQKDYDRYVKQSKIVKQIVTKFEEPSFSDDDEKCRTYIWDRMQEMQAEGAPPEELVKNPFPGTEFGGIPGLGGGGEGEGMPEEGCPTQ